MAAQTRMMTEMLEIEKEALRDRHSAERRLDAERYKHRTCARNNQLSRAGSHFLTPLRKQVAGDGYELAASVAENVQVYEVPELPSFVSLEVGGILHDDTIQVQSLDDTLILLYIRFYNVKFGIKRNDSLYTRRLKFANWLCGVSDCSLDDGEWY